MNIDFLQLPLDAGVAVLESCMTGSSYTVDPPVTTTDEDILLLVSSATDFAKYLHSDGWQDCLSAEDEAIVEAYKEDPAFGLHWLSFRKSKYNLIFTEDPNWYLRAVAATQLCKFLNIKDKAHRIIAFRTIRDGSDSKGELSEILKGL